PSIRFGQIGSREPPRFSPRSEGRARAGLAPAVSGLSAMISQGALADMTTRWLGLAVEFRSIAEPLGVIMRSFIETGAIIAACGSAIFWFASAMCRLPKPSANELDTITELSKALQRMNRWNFWAAGLMGITALLSALGRFLGRSRSLSDLVWVS